MSSDQAVTARAAMLIRRPAAEVFEAFVDPAVTSRFWFTGGSGRLEAGRRVTWEWRMYGVSAQVDVKTVEPTRRILAEWAGAGEAPTTVEWLFSARDDGTTFVRIANWGFRGDAGEIARQAIASTEGFALVLSALKALLEHGIALGLVADRFPPGIDHSA